MSLEGVDGVHGMVYTDSMSNHDTIINHPAFAALSLATREVIARNADLADAPADQVWVGRKGGKVVASYPNAWAAKSALARRQVETVSPVVQ